MADIWSSEVLWLLRTSVTASVLILLALLLARFTRQPARRQRLCELGLAAALLATVVSLAPAWLVVGLPLARPAAAAAVEAPSLPDSLWLTPEGLPLAVVPEATFDVPPPPAPDAVAPVASRFSLATAIGPIVLALYAAGVLLFLLRWLGGTLQLRRLLRQTQPVPPKVVELLGLTSESGPRLVVSRRLRVPISCGVWRPTVVLPAEFCQPAAQARLSWVLAHELTHIERRDALSGLLFALGQAVFFHLPWFWLLKKQVRLCQEYVADAAAVAERPAEDYAEFLLTFTETKAVPLGATGVSGPVSDLFRRVTMLLQNPLRVEKRCPRLWTWGLAGVLLALAALLGGIGLHTEAGDTIVIIISGQKTKEAAKNDKAKQPAGSVRVEVLTLDKGGNVITHDERAKPRAAEPRGHVWVQRALAVDGDKVSADELKLLHKVIQELDAIRGLNEKRGTDTKELRELIDRIHVRVKKTQPAPAGAERKKAENAPKDGKKAIVSDPSGAFKLWIEREPETLQHWLVKPSQVQAHVLAGAQVDLRKLQQLLERLQKDPGKVNAEEIHKAVEEIRKVAPDTRLSPAHKLQWNIMADQGHQMQFSIAGTEPETKGRFGIRFNVPSKELREYLGLPKEQGIIITGVFPGTPAAKAGLKVRDIVLKLNDAPVPSHDDRALKMFSAVKDGASVDLTILRRGKEEVIKGLQPALRKAAATQWRLAPRIPGLNLDKVPDKGALLSILNDGAQFTARHREKNLSITVEGRLKAGQAGDLSITVTVDGKTAFQGTDPAAVPESWRQRVNRLLQLIRTDDAVERERK